MRENAVYVLGSIHNCPYLGYWRPNRLTITASKQMLYGVFCNVVAMIEELERRERPHWCQPLPTSNLEIPDQSHKTDEDVRIRVVI